MKSAHGYRPTDEPQYASEPTLNKLGTLLITAAGYMRETIIEDGKYLATPLFDAVLLALDDIEGCDMGTGTEDFMEVLTPVIKALRRRQRCADKYNKSQRLLAQGRYWYFQEQAATEMDKAMRLDKAMEAASK
jgi:hypothetical protein